MSRGAVVVLMWGALVHQMTDYSAGYVIIGAYATPDLFKYLFISLPCAQMVGFVLYPIAGVIADSWNRLGVMLAGLCVQSIATLIITALVITMHFVDDVRGLWYVWAIVICCFGLVRAGLAVYEPNGLQMGSIQMPSASSDQLSAYVHWFYWTLLLGQAVINVVILTLTIFIDFISAARYTVLYACFAQLVSIPVVIILVWSHRRTLSVTLPHRNPLQQLRKVLKYAMKHKYPEQRSAFTYGELPSRLDLAKHRYGGPFTTEQVEDVKSFFRIFLVLVSAVGFRFLDVSGTTGGHLRAVANPNMIFEYGFNFVTIQIFGMSILIIFIGIPVYQLLVKPMFYRYLTTMLKRIFIGLLLQLMSICILQVLEGILADHIATTYGVDACAYYDNFTLRVIVQNSDNSTSVELPFHYQWIIIPQVLTGLTFLLVFLTVFEFILAQSPHNMQGLLIGIWYSAYLINLIISALEQIGCFLWITSIKASVSVVLLVAFVLVGIKYQRRLRDEPTQHNQQQVLEEVYDKYLTQEHTSANNIQERGSMVVVTAVK